MRITENMITSRVMQNLWRNMSELDKLNNQISSGKKFSKPSDDPVGVVSAMKIQSIIDSYDKFQSNVDEGIGLLNTTEGALQDLGNVLSRVKELAVQGASDTLDDDARRGIAAEIRQLKDEALNIANTDQGGRYIFAGTNFNIPPLTQSWAWQGNDSIIKYQVGQGTKLEVNIPGGGIFRDIPPNGQKNLNDTFDSLIQHLETPGGNAAAISQQDLNNIQAHIDNVLRDRVQLGAKVNSLEATKSRLADQTNNLKGLLSKDQDINLAEVITQLKSQQDTYNASLATAAQVIQPTLIDFLK